MDWSEFVSRLVVLSMVAVVSAVVVFAFHPSRTNTPNIETLAIAPSGLSLKCTIVKE